MTASIHQHFISIQPGLEKILLEEIKAQFFSDSESESLYQISNISMTKGGVQLSCPLATTEYLLKFLMSPTKILLRIAEFKATDFPKLFQKARNIAWSNYLRYPQYNLEVISHKSRLIHTGRIQATFEQAIKEYYSKHLPSEKQKLMLPDSFFYPIHIRLEEDLCTISIDISKDDLGRPFYQKQIKQKNSTASLRENLAFCLLRTTPDNINLRDYILLDPMAGAGTIPLVLLNKGIDKKFVLDYLKLSYPKLKKQQPISIEKPKSTWVNDLDLEHFQILKQNFSNIPLSTVTNLDFKLLTIDQPTIVFCNLPYGKRIEIESSNFKHDLFRWSENPNIKFMSYLAPSDWKSDFLKHGFDEFLKFRNGGIAVSIYTKLS